MAGGSVQSTAPMIGSSTAGVPGVSGDPTSYQNLLVHPAVVFVELRPTLDELARIELLTRHTAGPFDDTKHEFAFVDVYFDRTLPPEQERSEFSADGTLQLVLVTRHRDGTRRFWRLELSAGDPDPSNQLGMDLLSISDEPDEHERIVVATGDPSVPLVDIQDHSNSFGANSGVDLTRHLIVDLRRPSPRLIAVLDDVQGFGGGACGAYDGLYTTGHELGCRWDGGRGDFQCAETFHRYDTDWGEQRGSRFFLLDSGETVPYPTNGSRTLRAFAEGAVSARQAGSAILEGNGAATIVRTLSYGTTTLAIIGTPHFSETRSAQFAARFHVAILRPGQPTIVEELVPRTRLDTGQL